MLPTIIAVFLRAVRDPALAYDLVTETLAGARWAWCSPPEPSDRVAWVIERGAAVLAAAQHRTRVPSTERRRGQQPTPSTLTVAQQQRLMALAEDRLELSATAQAAADDLAHTAPPRHVLRVLRRSDLVEAEPLPDNARDRHGH